MVTKLTQSRLHVPGKQRGNCFPTVLACLMGLDDPEKVFQVQEHYDGDDWMDKLYEWLLNEGWEYDWEDGHFDDDRIYMVSGDTERGVCHVVLYQNGKLWHDPHPSGAGLISEEYFNTLTKIK